jgi:hypothetical protein
MKSLVSQLSENLFGFEREERAGEPFRFRIIELAFAVAALGYAWKWADYMQRLEVVVRPLGLANYLDVSVLFGPSAYIVAVFITLGLALGFLRVFRYGYALAFVGLLIQFAGRYSAGEIPHSSNLTGIGIMAFALAMAFFDREEFRRKLSLGVIYFMLGVTYVSAGISKLIATGPTWPHGAHLWTWIQSRHFHDLMSVGFDQFTPVESLVLSSLPIATLCLVIGLVTELFAWLVWLRKTRTIAMLAILGLHIGIYFTMGIFFIETTILFVIMLIPFDFFYRAFTRERGEVVSTSRAEQESSMVIW